MTPKTLPDYDVTQAEIAKDEQGHRWLVLVCERKVGKQTRRCEVWLRRAQVKGWAKVWRLID